MSSSMVTVVIPTIAEHADLLPRALMSAHRQTILAEAVIVVRDREHRGAAWARNQGLAKVTTPYVMFVDDDDELDPDHLKVLTEGMAATGADLVYGCIQVIGDRDPLAVAYQGQWIDPCGVEFGPEQERHLRYQGNFIPIGWLARTDLVRQAGGFPPSGGQGMEEDYQLLLNLLDLGARFAHVGGGRRTYRYHIHGGNTGGGAAGTGGSNQAIFRQREG